MKFLFLKRGFLPFLVVLFINSFICVAHYIVISVTIFKIFDGAMFFVLNLIFGAFIALPFVFLFSLIGFVNNKYSKTSIIRICAIYQAILSFLLFISYYFGWFYVALILSLFLAIQSAFYSVAKFALIKKLVGVPNLGYANGLVWALMLFSALVAFFMFSIFDESYTIKNAGEILRMR